VYIPVSLLDSHLSATFSPVLTLLARNTRLHGPCVEVGNSPEQQEQPETARITGIKDGRGPHPVAIPGVLTVLHIIDKTEINDGITRKRHLSAELGIKYKPAHNPYVNLSFLPETAFS